MHLKVIGTSFISLALTQVKCDRFKSIIISETSIHTAGKLLNEA